ncbi:hypothetical protein B0H34DRAFT_203551 [Crassisporium funariophilum]|nr:hypothetical protein B0H34DRAFT_203551 [Crassisporium funariophilum]
MCFDFDGSYGARRRQWLMVFGEGRWRQTFRDDDSSHSHTKHVQLYFRDNIDRNQVEIVSYEQ